MTTAELMAIARDVVPPLGASGVCLVMDEQQRHHAGFVIGGRHKVAVGAGFARPRDAVRLLHLLDGDAPAPRSAAVIPAAAPLSPSGGKETGEPDQLLTGAPCQMDGGAPLCAGCDEPLPPGRRGQRRLTHGPACRQAARRRAAVASDSRDIDGGGGMSHLPARSTTGEPQAQLPTQFSSAAALGARNQPLAPEHGPTGRAIDLTPQG